MATVPAASSSAAGNSVSKSSLPGIERLTGRENWAICKFAVESFLELEDLWCTVKAKTAREVWSTFEDTGLTSPDVLLHKLIKTEQSSCDSMTDNVNRIVTTAHQLEGISFAISDEWVGSLLLTGLPDEYRPMIMALENSGTPITRDAIKTKLLQEIQAPSEDYTFSFHTLNKKI